MNPANEYRAARPEDLKGAAQSLLAACPEARVFAFFGPMGVGKTAFIKSICQRLGAVDIVNSPTFSIVNHYATESGTNIYHFDFYRVESLEEVYDIGYEDYLYSGSYCFIEWPEKVEGLLPEDSIRVSMEEVDGTRIIRF